MIENEEQEICTEKTRKVFTNQAISMATFFGGPLAAGFLMAKNYIAFGNRPAAQNTLIISFISSILVLALVSIMPHQSKDAIPNMLLPMFYTAVVTVLVANLQGSKIDEYINTKGAKASNWLAFGYGMLGAAITFILIFTFAYNVPYQGYERSIKVNKNITLYYKKTIDTSYSKHVSSTIELSGFLDIDEDIDVFLSEESDTYLLKFIITDRDVLLDKEFLTDFKTFEQLLNYHLRYDKSLRVAFTDEFFEELFEIPETVIPNSLGYDPFNTLNSYSVNKFHTIYYNDNMPLSDVEIVESSIKRLRGYFPPNVIIDIVFLKNQSDYTIKFFVSKDLWNDSSIIERLRSTVVYIRDNGISSPIRLILVDNNEYEEKEVF